MEVTYVVDPDAVKKPEAPEVTREAPEGEPAAPGEPAADVEEEEPAAEETAAEDMKVRSVLFTSFIIQ